MCLFDTGDCLIEVTAWAGLTVVSINTSTCHVTVNVLTTFATVCIAYLVLSGDWRWGLRFHEPVLHTAIFLCMSHAITMVSIGFILNYCVKEFWRFLQEWYVFLIIIVSIITVCIFILNPWNYISIWF